MEYKLLFLVVIVGCVATATSEQGKLIHCYSFLSEWSRKEMASKLPIILSSHDRFYLSVI